MQLCSVQNIGDNKRLQQTLKQKQYNAQKKSVIDENHNKFMNGGATQGYVTKDNNMKI